MPQVSDREEVGRNERDECAARMRMVYWVYCGFESKFYSFFPRSIVR